MSTLKANAITNSGASVNFPYNLQSTANDYIARPYVEQATPPTAPLIGQLWYNTSAGTANIYTGDKWVTLALIPATATWYGATGVFFGGVNSSGSPVTTIDSITIATTGNAASFGSLAYTTSSTASVAGGTRGLAMGGSTGSGFLNISQSVTISVPGNAAVYATNLMIQAYSGGAVSSGVYGVYAGGGTSAGAVTIMQRITIATTAAATYVGALPLANSSMASATDGTYGLFAGGNSSSDNTINYMTIATDAAASSFGTLTSGRYSPVGCSNTTYGLFMGGYTGSASTTAIDYVTIATPGNATSFGTLTVARNAGAGTSNGTRGIFGGGAITTAGSSTSNVIDYVTIATPGNATSFGTLTAARNSVSSCSGA